jgi:hypothetical protein
VFSFHFFDDGLCSAPPALATVSTRHRNGASTGASHRVDTDLRTLVGNGYPVASRQLSKKLVFLFCCFWVQVLEEEISSTP